MSHALEWLREFWKTVNAGPTDPIIWHCKPLLVLGPTGETEFFAKTTDVEFLPDKANQEAGYARVVGWTGQERAPELNVTSLDVQDYRDRGYTAYRAGREGIRLKGVWNGQERTWLMDGCADDYAYANARADR